MGQGDTFMRPWIPSISNPQGDLNIKKAAAPFSPLQSLA
jgi:hypothetical protein